MLTVVLKMNYLQYFNEEEKGNQRHPVEKSILGVWRNLWP